MAKATGPDLTGYVDKLLMLKLNGRRTVQGVLRGFDQFMNIVLEDAVEIVSATEKNKLGTAVVRGNSILMIEASEPIAKTNYNPQTSRSAQQQ